MKLLLGLFMTLIASSALGFSYTKEFTEAELQERVEALMPFEKKKLFLKTVISNPKIDLHRSSNQMSIEANIEASAPGGFKVNGTTIIEGPISYSPATGSFHLNNPKIVDLRIDQVSEKYQSKIKELAQLAISNALKKFPIYTFKDDDIKHRLARSVLESVSIENEKLLVKLNAL